MFLLKFYSRFRDKNFWLATNSSYCGHMGIWGAEGSKCQWRVVWKTNTKFGGSGLEFVRKVLYSNFSKLLEPPDPTWISYENRLAILVSFSHEWLKIWGQGIFILLIEVYTLWACMNFDSRSSTLENIENTTNLNLLPKFDQFWSVSNSAMIF